MGKSITITRAKKELKRIKLALATQTNIAALQTEALQIFRAVIQPDDARRASYQCVHQPDATIKLQRAWTDQYYRPGDTRLVCCFQGTIQPLSTTLKPDSNVRQAVSRACRRLIDKDVPLWLQAKRRELAIQSTEPVELDHTRESFASIVTQFMQSDNPTPFYGDGQWCLPLQQQLAFLQLHRKLTSNWATVQAVTQSEHRARTATRRQVDNNK